MQIPNLNMNANSKSQYPNHKQRLMFKMTKQEAIIGGIWDLFLDGCLLFGI
jgi:hypothetical protein